MLLNPNNKVEYDIMSAMRGPDTDPLSPTGQYTKIVTTAVVRSLVGMPRSLAADVAVMSPEEAKEIWRNLKERDRSAVHEYLEENWHFSRHFRMAMNSLVKRKIPGALDYLKFYNSDIDIQVL